MKSIAYFTHLKYLAGAFEVIFREFVFWIPCKISDNENQQQNMNELDYFPNDLLATNFLLFMEIGIFIQAKVKATEYLP